MQAFFFLSGQTLPHDGKPFRPTPTPSSNATGESCKELGCQNGGICSIESVCSCSNGFEGKFCELKVDNCEWPYVGKGCKVNVIPIIVIVISLFGVLPCYLLLRKFYPLAENTVIFSLALTLYDFITDCLFVYSQGNGPEAYSSPLFYASLIFLVVPVLFNLCIIAYMFFSSILKEVEVERWLFKNYATAAGVAVLASTNVEIFTLLQSKLFYHPMFNAPFTPESVHFLLICGLIGNVLEDLPQLVIQLIAGKNSLDTIVVLSVVASLLTITFGIAKRGILFLLIKFGAAAREQKKGRGVEKAFTETEVGLRLSAVSASH